MLFKSFRILSIFLSLVYICIAQKIYNVQRAVINVPIADLLGQPIKIIYPNESIKEAYDTITICGDRSSSLQSCPRLHQLLYNEIVEVIKTNDDEACIRITHAYYKTSPSSMPQNQYWTLKKNITLLDDLTDLLKNDIPDPINFSDKGNHTLHSINVITLTEPHHDVTLNITFSAGTRFIQERMTKKSNSIIQVSAIDFKKMKKYQIKIPCHKCIIINPAKNPDDRISDYVNLLKKWAHPKRGFIPYVWGGTSFINTIQGSFVESTRKTENSDYSFYKYEKDTFSSPKSGFDCSGAVIRAAQICGIPYFYKNTTTIDKSLAPLAPGKQLSQGDLIFIQGHVMIVSNIQENKLIEARGYSHGYGKFHEVPISQVFKNIETYTDLIDRYFKKSAIERKDAQGKVRDTFSNFKLLSMASIWDNNEDLLNEKK